MVEVKFISIDDAKELLKGVSLKLFQEIFWWRIIDQGFAKHCKVALVREGNHDKVLLPLFFHKIGPILRVGSPLRGTFTPYIEFACLAKDIEAEKQAIYLKKIVHALLNEGAHWIEISCTSEKSQLYDGLKDLGFIAETPATIVLNTNQIEDSLWMGMQGRARNLVRKAQRFELKVEVLGPEVESIELFYSMLEETFRKSGMSPPHSKGFYELLVSKSIVSNNLLFLAVRKDSAVVAMGMFLHNFDEIHFISGTSTQEGNKYGANNLMHWEVIKFACDKGINSYDFGGMGIPAIDKFKRSFGGREENYISYVWMKAPVRFLFNMLMWVQSKIGFSLI